MRRNKAARLRSFRDWVSRSPPPSHSHPDPQCNRSGRCFSISRRCHPGCSRHSILLGLLPPPRASASPAAKISRLPLSVDPRGRDAGRNLGGSKGKRWRTPKAGHQPTILDCARACVRITKYASRRDNAKRGQTSPAAQTYFDVKSSDGRDRQRSVVYEGLRGQNEP